MIRKFLGMRSLAISLLVCAQAAYAESKQKLHVWVAGADAGVYSAVLDTTKGALSDVTLQIANQNFDYIVQHPKLDVLYAVSRPTKSTSAVRSFHVGDDASLKLQSEVSDRGADGAHITVSPDGKLLAVAYYTGGDIDVYALKSNGAIGKLVLNGKHEGSSVNKDRQNGPHPHYVGFSSDNRYLYVPDLGTDHVWVYRVQGQKISLAHKVKSQPGAGPRHLAFHPRLPYAYVSDELVSGVTAYKVNRKTGELSPIESLPSAAEASKERWHSVSDIRVHPSGKFLYLVNRGFDQVSVFSIDQKTGKLSPVEREPVRGSISRNIVLTEDGRWALVASRLTNAVAAYEILPETGEMVFLSGHIYPMSGARAIVIDAHP